MMFTDQRWIDFVPSLFDHHILKDPSYNVAYWNLHERDLQWDGTRYLVERPAADVLSFQRLRRQAALPAQQAPGRPPAHPAQRTPGRRAHLPRVPRRPRGRRAGADIGARRTAGRRCRRDCRSTARCAALPRRPRRVRARAAAVEPPSPFDRRRRSTLHRVAQRARGRRAAQDGVALSSRRSIRIGPTCSARFPISPIATAHVSSNGFTATASARHNIPPRCCRPTRQYRAMTAPAYVASSSLA